MIKKENIEDVLALTPMQEGMLFHYLKAPGGRHYFEQLTLHISGAIDTRLCRQAWQTVIETNEMLRTQFRWEKIAKPVQVVLKKHTLPFQYYDITVNENHQKEPGTTECKQWLERLEKVKKKDREKSFDLRHVPFRVTLCKTREDEHEMIISNHHILYDGWSPGHRTGGKKRVL
ncbi:MAG: hypothetical protein GY757_53495 [bacterium]|nr:hypothetical protein [bacterium]